MSFTRFHDDEARQYKQVVQSMYSGIYSLNTPGPGTQLPFLEDPQIRLEKWGANWMNNRIGIESDLRGLTRPLNRDYVDINDYKTKSATTSNKTYPSVPTFIDDTRISNPAWQLRDEENPRWETPFINPLANIEKPFADNIQSRIIAKN